MEGPTPVSALIHAATMVTAGVFLIIRCSPLFELSPSILVLITFVGAITSFFSATVGVVQNDIKKIIAYSTCSQLGYMIFACGISNYHVSLFHLVNHGFFKALLFLSAGALIHGLSNEQDIRKMGGLATIMPFTYTMFLVGSLSLMGVPFLSGFYSKDLIIEFAYSTYTLSGHFAYWLGTFTAFLTTFYSFRLIFIVFFGPCNVINKTVFNNIHELPLGMAIPLAILCFGSIFSGFFFKDLMVGITSFSFYEHSVVVLRQNTSGLDSEFIPLFYKLIPTFFSIIGFCLALIMYSDLEKEGSFLVSVAKDATSFDKPL